MPVLVSNLQEEVPVEDSVINVITQAVDCVLAEHNIPAEVEVSVALVDGDRIRELNNRYRGVDAVTDVLSFPMDDPDEEADGPETVLGDVVIALSVAKGQALEYGHTLRREVAYLTVHGVLHLLGFDHHRPEDKNKMRRHEEVALAALGLTRDA